MNTTEAKTVVAAHLATYRDMTYAELSARVDSVETAVASGASGTVYQLETQFFWDEKPHGDVRVMAAIDDGGLRAFVPVTDDFIISHDGSFVGE